MVKGLSRNFDIRKKNHDKKKDVRQLEAVKKGGKDILELGSHKRS
jgi:hypothetical protein